MNVYVSLTTIPSRFNNVYKTIDSIVNQTHKVTQIFLNIPPSYVRFPDQSISDEDIKNLSDRYSEILTINRIEKDYGPGSKIMGIPTHVIEEDAFVILVDDDVSYSNHMVETHVTEYLKDKEIHSTVKKVYGTEFVDIYGKFNMIQVVGSMGIPTRSLKQLAAYHLFVSNFEPLFFVDDLWITYYFVKKGYEIKKIEIPENLTYTTSIDGLVLLNGSYRRGKLLMEGYYLLRGGDADNRLWFINNE